MNTEKPDPDLSKWNGIIYGNQIWVEGVKYTYGPSRIWGLKGSKFFVEHKGEKKKRK